MGTGGAAGAVTMVRPRLRRGRTPGNKKSEDGKEGER
jgi:hypothetical protein